MNGPEFVLLVACRTMAFTGSLMLLSVRYQAIRLQSVKRLSWALLHSTIDSSCTRQSQIRQLGQARNHRGHCSRSVITKVIPCPTPTRIPDHGAQIRNTYIRAYAHVHPRDQTIRRIAVTRSSPDTKLSPTTARHRLIRPRYSSLSWGKCGSARASDCPPDS